MWASEILTSISQTPPSWSDSPKGASLSEVAVTRARRRKSFGADSPEVVTTGGFVSLFAFVGDQIGCLLLWWSDQIRPDWETKLATVRAQAQRRANRRIIMRQVGDRLIPVGVTSGRVHALTEDGGDAEGSRPGNRRRRRNQGQNPALDRLLGQVDIAGQDIEEVSRPNAFCGSLRSVLTEVSQLMIMEAMRLSLIEHEQQQQRQREEEERNRRNGETSERGRSTEVGNNTNLTVPSSGQRSSSMTPPESVGGVDHRTSSSVPNNNPLDGLQADGSWRRDTPQFSRFGAEDTVSAVPLSSFTTRTGGTDGDSTTISSESSGTGRSSTRPTIDAVDEVEGGVDYTTLPSSPESSGQPHLFLARTGDGETTGSRSRTPE